MKQVYKIDVNGYYVAPVILKKDDNNHPDCVEIKPPNGLFKARFVNGTWAEGLSSSELAAIKNTPRPKSELEILKEQQKLIQDVLDELILGGGF